MQLKLHLHNPDDQSVQHNSSPLTQSHMFATGSQRTSTFKVRVMLCFSTCIAGKHETSRCTSTVVAVTRTCSSAKGMLICSTSELVYNAHCQLYNFRNTVSTAHVSHCQTQRDSPGSKTSSDWQDSIRNTATGASVQSPHTPTLGLPVYHQGTTGSWQHGMWRLSMQPSTCLP
jgi:hypothetical protein